MPRFVVFCCDLVLEDFTNIPQGYLTNIEEIMQ